MVHPDFDDIISRARDVERQKRSCEHQITRIVNLYALFACITRLELLRNSPSILSPLLAMCRQATR